MKPALFIASGVNRDSFTNALWALARHLSPGLRIDKVLVLESSDTKEPMRPDDERDKYFREIRDHMLLALDRDVELRIRILPADLQAVMPRLVVDGVKEMGRDAVVIDLTTGTKTMTAVLYACASFARLDHLYKVSVRPKPDGKFAQLWTEPQPDQWYTVEKLDSLKDVQPLASQSFFDLVAYNDELTEIDGRAPEDFVEEVQLATNFLRMALPLMFGNPPAYRQAVHAIGMARESINGLIVKTVEKLDPTALGLKLDDLDKWAKGFRKALKEGTSPLLAASVPGVLALDCTMDTLRHWRNYSAHAYPTQFGISEVRVAMSTAIHLLETVITVWSDEGAAKP
jgi:hypothetical protein